MAPASPLAHIRIEPKPGHGIVICLHHHYCLQPKGVWQHFSGKHADHTTVEDRKALQEYVDSQLEHLHHELADLSIPTVPCPAVTGLKLYRDSLKCNQCLDICTGKTAVENMKSHLRNKHDIFASDIANNKERAAWWKSHWRVVCSQQFFARDAHASSARHTKFFEVVEGHIPNEAEVSSTDTVVVDETIPAMPDVHDSTTSTSVDPALIRLDELQADLDMRERAVMQEEKLAHAIVPLVPARQTNPYLEHTQFHQCVAGMSWSAVREYTAVTPSTQLQYLRDTVKSTMLVYQHCVRLTSRWVRICVMQEHLQHIPVSPLVTYQSLDNRHSGTVVSIFTFFYHVFKDNVPFPSTLTVNEHQTRIWKRIELQLQELHPRYPKVDTKHSRTRMEPLESLCHDFWMSLIEQTALQRDFELAIVTPLAFIAVDATKDQFREAYNFATDCSAIKKYARFAACFKLYDPEQAAQNNSDPPDILCNEDDVQELEVDRLIKQQEQTKLAQAARETATKASSDEFKDWVHRYLTSEYPTTMNWVITTSHYIARFRYGETIDAFVRWNGSSVTIRHLTTTFERYIAMVWGLYHRAEASMNRLTFTAKSGDILQIPWDLIQCDPANNTPGYHPFSTAHQALSHGRGFVRQQMLRAIRENQHKDTRIDQITNYHQIQRYSEQVHTFKLLLFLLVHFTSGQPGRLTEVLSVQIQNTVANGSRNVFLFQGHIAIVPRYHKGYNRDKSLKIAYRFLPREIGSLLVWYLWLVRPFYAALSQGQTGQEQTSHYHQARSSFLWSSKTGDQPESAAQVTTSMKAATLEYLGTETGPSTVRHLIVTFGRHSKERGAKIQALTPEQVEETLDEIDADALERQANHTPNTGYGIYAVEMAVVFRSLNNTAESFFRVSTQWHRDLGFQPPTLDKILSKKYYPATSHSVNVKILLIENFGRTADFRGQQRMVLESIMEGHPAVAYIAATGSGKSLAFLLPPCYSEYGQTVVITPLVALRTDLHAKCTELSLTTSLFGSKIFDETARVIFAMPEHLASHQFQGLVNRLRDLGRLERIVVDEFHVVLLDDHEYRPSLLALRELTQHGVPITLLSATVPPALAAEAFRLLGLGGSVSVFREPTVRKNIRYEVETLVARGRTTTDDMASYIKQQQELYKKIVVYVAHARDAEAISKALRCLCYHGQLTEQDRLKAQEEFTKAERAVLLATIAFSNGVDVPNIELVIQMGEPDNAINYLQASGRGGRDGRVCVARIVLGQGIPSYLEKQLPSTRRVIEDFVERGRNMSGCFRVPIDRYIDGDDKRTCCRPDEEACGFCATLAPPYTSSQHMQMSQSTGKSAMFETPQRTRPVQSSLSGPSTRPRSDVDLGTISQHYELSPPSTLRRVPIPSTPLPIASTSPSGTEVSLELSTPVRYGSAQSAATHHKRAHSQATTSSPATSSRSLQADQDSSKRARIQRTLFFNQQQALNRKRDAARVLDELKATGIWWTDNCVKCFTDRQAFDHPKATCENYTKDLVNEFRGARLGGKLPPGTCFWCGMPISFCARWVDEDGKKRSQPSKQHGCNYPHTILDTWACLWGNSEKAKLIWQQRIADETAGELDGEKADDFQRYFMQTVPVAGGRPIGRIAYDVNWFTHTYVLADNYTFQDVV